jgi:hypothetical protein
MTDQEAYIIASAIEWLRPRAKTLCWALESFAVRFLKAEGVRR